MLKKKYIENDWGMVLFKQYLSKVTRPIKTVVWQEEENSAATQDYSHYWFICQTKASLTDKRMLTSKHSKCIIEWNIVPVLRKLHVCVNVRSSNFVLQSSCMTAFAPWLCIIPACLQAEGNILMAATEWSLKSWIAVIFVH